MGDEGELVLVKRSYLDVMTLQLPYDTQLYCLIQNHFQNLLDSRVEFAAAIRLFKDQCPRCRPISAGVIGLTGGVPYAIVVGL